MAKLDPRVADHLEWIGFVQPTGLVVSAPALVHADAILDRHDAEGQRRFRDCVEERGFEPDAGPEPYISDFEAFAQSFLDWDFSSTFYAGFEGSPIPTELKVVLPEYDETLQPDYAVREPDPEEGDSDWQLLVRTLEPGEAFDRVVTRSGFAASHQARMERLLRNTEVPAGILFNGQALRLISAPRGESSGWLDFKVAEMVETAGRPICTAMGLLLKQSRLLALPRNKRLAALLEESRRFQNEVSEQLAEQVLHALYELLRGFQAAHDASGRDLLRDPLAENPDRVYHALLTVILRLVFLLYAEEREMLPDDDPFVRHYSLASLYERLREDAALYPDTMDQRFGAWAQLLVLFRMVFDGAESERLRLPRRHGVLFDPDRFPFLEGRTGLGARQVNERIEPPLVSDGTICRALDKLLVLDGERISYRALDVEQIGSVYETMMGFRLETASGLSVAIRSPKKHGAPATIDLERLLEKAPGERAKWVRDRTDRNLPPAVTTEVKAAASRAELHAALDSVVDKHATPDLVPQGAMVLQPSEMRRKSGSHYTPRSLTAPIVRTTLEPILARLRASDEDGAERPLRPQQILDLKVCDPAMGSAAFLVETCRYLGDALVESWRTHDVQPEVPPDEDEVVFARRLVAQRCLYGVDRNPIAVDLAKVSLWLVTLAKDHPFTFLDHALRHGDSLVGLSRRQIEAFHWETSEGQQQIVSARVRQHLERFTELRREIREAGEDTSDQELRQLWSDAQAELESVRLFGDLVIAAFFEGSKTSEREAKRQVFASAVSAGEADKYRGWLEELRDQDPPLAPFHWEVEFPEVFEREIAGFDAFVGNPPFQGGRNISAIQGSVYSQWLLHAHDGASGGADLVAHFFRRAFALLRNSGTLGLIATNTIAQGDTRASGLRWICKNGGEIYRARRRLKWPGKAAVVVSVVHIIKGRFSQPRTIDDNKVDTITAFLFHRGGHDDPERLGANVSKSFQGCIILGMGFTFDDADSKGVATSIAEMERWIREDERNQEVIFPYIGGQEVNTSPTHAHHRYVINFRERDEEECRRRWPDLFAIVEEKVKPERTRKDAQKYPRMVYEWWKYWNPRPELQSAASSLERVLAISRVGQRAALTFVPTGSVYADSLVIFPFETYSAFCALQSRPHEIWARFFGSSMKDDLRYTPSDCFETFPFPNGWENDPDLEVVGKEYYEYRAQLMIDNDEGLTKTYNRFHDPEETDPRIEKLREFHTAMDRAVLAAYGWEDIPTDCEFLLDYEIDEENWNPRKKKPWRYRWPDEVHDEVLARLLELNKERAAADASGGLSDNAHDASENDDEGATAAEMSSGS